DVARYPFPAKVLWPEESAVAAARVEPKCRIPGKRRWYSPWLRLDMAASLCRRTPKQSGIHNEALHRTIAPLSFQPPEVVSVGDAVQAEEVVACGKGHLGIV
uniref:hypothetical protein n=1 Tax=Candidatus Thiosymbion oneisti TaxID=589554 RepID=UPI001C40655A